MVPLSPMLGAFGWPRHQRAWARRRRLSSGDPHLRGRADCRSPRAYTQRGCGAPTGALLRGPPTRARGCSPILLLSEHGLGGSQTRGSGGVCVGIYWVVRGWQVSALEGMPRFLTARWVFWLRALLCQYYYSRGVRAVWRPQEGF